MIGRTNANSNLGGKLLWTNNNPSSAFAQQTVSLDLSKYKQVIIKSITSINYQTSYGYTIINVGSIGIIGAVESSDVLRGTRFTNVANTGIAFGYGAALNTGDYSSSEDNNYAIPVEIYGLSIKIV